MPLGTSDPDQLTFWSEEPHARASASPDSEREWLTLVATWPSHILPLLTGYGHVGSSLRTYPVSCLADQDGTLVPSSGRWLNSGMGGPTASWTHSTSEWHSAAVVCLLSDTLVTGDVPPQYFLSPRACSGILRRAERRQKQLPPMLKVALEQVVSSGTASKSQEP